MEAHEKELIPLNAYEQCPKCGNGKGELGKQWHKMSYQLTQGSDGMACVCNRCGFFWVERCADYKEPIDKM